MIIISDNHNGLLAIGNNNQESLIHSLRILMNDSKLRKHMSQNAIASMKQFNPNKIYDQWEELFDKVSNL